MILRIYNGVGNKGKEPMIVKIKIKDSNVGIRVNNPVWNLGSFVSKDFFLSNWQNKNEFVANMIE